MEKLEPTLNNYPIGILLNNFKDQLLFSSKTPITISAGSIKWNITMDDLLEIMKTQTVVQPDAY